MLTTSRLGVALLLLATPAAAQVLAARLIPSDATALAMTSGDLDGDGLSDIVTSGFGMAVLLHEPAGGFAEAGTYTFLNVTGPVASGHLDGDGALDVVFNIISSGTKILAYRLGDGAGGLGPAVAIGLPAFPRGLAVGDLDGDGDDDVAVGGSSLDQVLLLFSDGAGGLAPPVGVAVDGAPYDVQAGDLDDDGDLDLVTADSGSDTVSVLANDGTAAFTITSHPVPEEPLSVLIADVDEDAAPDLVVRADETALLLGNGAGGFAPFQTLPEVMKTLVFADVDGDGFGDLVGFGEVGLQVLFGADGPDFVAGPAGLPTGEFNDGVLVLDADLDGLPDLVASDGHVIILRGQGFGAFESVSVSTCVGPPQAATTGDFDNDGDVDAALANAANFVGGGVVVLSNQHGGTLTQVSSIGMGKMYDIETGDVDDNGDLDLVSASHFMGLKLQLGDGSGTYGAASPVGGVYSDDAALGDMDGDGDTDIASCWGFGATARVGFFLSDGMGGFTGPKSKVIGVSPAKVRVADLNVDGQLDLVTLAQLDRLVLAVLVHGGALGEPITTPLINYPWEMDLGHIDSDGWPDLVTLEEDTPNAFEVRRGNGAGGFVPDVSAPASGAIYDLVVTDMSGDDVADIVSTGGNPINVVLAVNDGTGGFGESQEHVAGFHPLALTTGDLTGDGLRDALVVNYDGGLLTTLELLPNVGPDEPWISLGAGKMGASGIPMFVAHGTLQPDEPLTLELRGAAANSPATLVIGTSALFAPLKGGVLVPAPSFLLAGLVTNGQGGVTLGADWPSDVPAGLQTWYQFWIADGGASFGFSASNGVTAVAP